MGNLFLVQLIWILNSCRTPSLLPSLVARTPTSLIKTTERLQSESASSGSGSPSGQESSTPCSLQEQKPFPELNIPASGPREPSTSGASWKLRQESSSDGLPSSGSSPTSTSASCRRSTTESSPGSSQPPGSSSSGLSSPLSSVEYRTVARLALTSDTGSSGPLVSLDARPSPGGK